MPAKKLKEFLDKESVKYVNIKHSPAYTAHEIAQSAHIPGKELAKTVIIKVDGKMAMVVISANDKVNFDKLEQAIGSGGIELATEREFQDEFPGCEVGAMPPFGNLFDMDVYIDEKLTHSDDIAFNAGTHSELVRMTYGDYAKIVNPTVLTAA